MMRNIRWTRAAAVLGVIAGGLGLLRAAAPAAPAQTLTAAGSPKEVIVTFFDGLQNGDEKAVFGSLWFVNDQVKAEADAILGVSFARGKFEKAMADVFHEKPPSQDVANIGAAMRTQMEAASVSIDGDAAQVKAGTEVFKLVRKEGQWKIDFDEMQKADKSPRMGKEDLEIMQAGIKVYSDMAVDVTAKNFKTAEEAKAELNRRMDAAPMSSEARRTATQRGLATVVSALETFDVENGRLPTTEEGLTALVKEPAALKGKSWQPVLSRVPRDAWGRDFIYRSPGKDGKRYEVYSAGEDGKPDTADDVR